MRFVQWKMALAAAGFAALLAPAQAEVINLKLATLSPPGTPLNDRVLHPWAEAVNKDGEGVVHIEVVDGLQIGNFGNIYDRVLSDVVQVAWGLQPPVGGKFLLSSVAALPFLTKESADSSAALWRLYESGLISREYDQIQPLMLVGFPQSGIQLAKPLDSNTSLAGRKIAVADKIQADIVSAMGGAPQSLQLPDIYEALQRGTVDGASFGYSTYFSFKLHEVSSVHLEVPLGASTGMVFMSKAKWDSLPQAAKDVFAKHMGVEASRGFGEYWDNVDKAGRAMVDGKPGHTVVTLSPDELAVWRAKAEPIVNGFMASLPDGDKVEAEFKKLLAEEEAK